MSTAAVLVTSCDDDGGFDTLRHAVLVADPGATIDLAGLACSKITLQTAIAVTVSDLTILGPGSSALTIDANHIDRVFNHTGAGTLTLSNLTIANGKRAANQAEGGCIYAVGSLVLNRVIVTSCTALGQNASAGGAIFANGDLDLESSTLADSSAQTQFGAADLINAAGGGAISGGKLTLMNSVISGNTAQASIGKTFAGGLAAPSVTAKYSTFTGNKALAAGTAASAGVGGAIYAPQLLMRGSTVDHNQADIAGALYVHYIDPTSYGTIVQSTISTNSANLAVGGILAQATFGATNSTIAFNAGGSYGGPGLGVPTGVTATLQSTIIADNAPLDVDGGGTIAGVHNLIKIPGATVTLPLGTSTLDPQLGPLQFNGGRTRTHTLMPGSPAIDQGDDDAGLATDQRGPTYRRIAPISGKADIGAYEVDDDHVFGEGFEATPPLI